MTNKINNVFLWILLFPMILLCIKAYNNIESYNYNCDGYYDSDYCNTPYDCSIPCYDICDTKLDCQPDCQPDCQADCDENLESGTINVGGSLTMDGNYLDQLPDNFNEINVAGDLELSDNTVKDRCHPPPKCLPPPPRFRPRCAKKCRRKCRKKCNSSEKKSTGINNIKQKLELQQLQKLQLQQISKLDQTLLPGGSWKDTARNIRIEGDNILIAELQNQNGTFNQDLVIFQPSDSFSNENGQFKLI